MTSFRCPHCQQRTISAWQKLKSNGWKPSQCSQCGGKYVPIAWFSLVPILIFAAVLYIGLRGASPFSPTGGAVILVASAVISFLVAAAIYLFTPLLRHRSAAARWDMWSFIAVFGVLAVVAALQPEAPAPKQEVIQRGPTAWHFTDRDQGEEYKARLRSQNIPFTVEMRDGKEFILVESRKAVEPKK
jgi:uncharacterized protein YhhL (DUF1145 family)